MGRQVNFFMGKRDVDEFVHFVLKNKEVVMLVNGQKNEDECIIDVLPEDSNTWVYFWNQSISPPPTFKYIEKRKYFLIDQTISEVVEFSRAGGIKHHILDEGRIWIGTAYMKNDAWISKSKRFLLWYESLARWIKKQSLCKCDYLYVMKEAASLFREHDAFVQKFCLTNVPNKEKSIQ